MQSDVVLEIDRAHEVLGVAPDLRDCVAPEAAGRAPIVGDGIRRTVDLATFKVASLKQTLTLALTHGGTSTDLCFCRAWTIR